MARAALCTPSARRWFQVEIGYASAPRHGSRSCSISHSQIGFGDSCFARKTIGFTLVPIELLMVQFFCT